jgi:hypothetical protein
MILTPKVLVWPLLNSKVKRITNSHKEIKMKNKYGVSPHVLETNKKFPSLAESTIDVTDLIHNKKNPRYLREFL